MRCTAVTLPVNPPDEPVRLSRAQLWAALDVKSRDPMRFVAPITSCEVLSESATGLVRRVHLTDLGTKEEHIEHFAPSLAVFKMSDPPAFITNLVSETQDGDLLLTFSFAWGENGPLDESEAAVAKEEQQKKLAAETIARTLQVARELVLDGEIKA